MSDADALDPWIYDRPSYDKQLASHVDGIKLEDPGDDEFVQGGAVFDYPAPASFGDQNSGNEEKEVIAQKSAVFGQEGKVFLKEVTRVGVIVNDAPNEQETQCVPRMDYSFVLLLLHFLSLFLKATNW